MNVNVLNIIDFEKIDSLLGGFHKITGFATAILDLEGNVLSKSGWRQICTQFHRVNPETAKKCAISDTELANKLAKGEKFHFYRCLNGLVDVAVPIEVNGEHIANLFAGQFFFEEPDRTFFKKQGKKYGFDEDKYLHALEMVPVVSKEEVKTTIDFLLNMVLLISDMTYQKLEQKEVSVALKRSDERWQFAIEGNGDGLWDWNVQTNDIFFSKQWKEMLGFSEDEFENKFDEWDKRVHPDDKTKAYDAINAYLDGISEVYNIEYRMLCKDGSSKWILDRGKIVTWDADNKPLRFIGTHTDITDRKQAEDIILRNKNRLHYALDTIETGAWELDLIHRDSWRSFNHDKIFGYTEPLAYWTYDMFLEHVLPEDREQVDMSFQKAIATKTNWNFECRINRKDGAVRWIFGNGNHEFDKRNVATKMFGIVQDITDRKEAEKKLKESEEKFKLAFLTSPDAININRLDDGLYIDVNDSFLQMTGYSREETIGKTSSEINIWCNIEDRKKLVEGLKKYGKVENLESKFKLKNNRVIDGLMSATVISIADGPHILSITRDISSLKLAKEALQKSEEKFRTFSQISPVGIFVTDVDGKTIYWNDKLDEITGMPIEEGKGTGWVGSIHPDDKEMVFNEWYHSTESRSRFDLTYRFKNKDGKVTWVIGQAVPMKDASGELIGFVGSIVDITESKKAEKAIKESEEKFKMSFYSNPVPQSILTLDGTIVEANQAFANLIGFKIEDIIGRTSTDLGLLSKEERNKLATLTAESNGMISNALCKFKIRDGRLRDIMYSVEPIMLNGIQHRLSMGIDVTEQKQAETQIRESEERFRTIFDQSASGMCITGLDGKMLSVNTPLCEMLGYKKQELEGLHFNSITYPEDIEIGNVSVIKMLEGKSKKAAFEKRYLTKSGKIIWVRINTVLLRDQDNDPLYFVTQVEDVTMRVNADIRLKTSENKYKALVEQSLTGIYIFNKNGYLYANDRFCDIFGYSEEEVLSNLKPTDIIAVEDQEKALQHIEKRLIGEVPSVRYVAKGNHKTGQLLWVEIHGTHIELEGEDVITGTVLDITHRKLAEDEIVKHREHLEELVNERTKELEIKISEIERMNKLFVGREIRMKELKGLIKDLEQQLKMS